MALGERGKEGKRMGALRQKLKNLGADADRVRRQAKDASLIKLAETVALLCEALAARSEDEGTRSSLPKTSPSGDGARRPKAPRALSSRPDNHAIDRRRRLSPSPPGAPLQDRQTKATRASRESRSIRRAKP